MYIGVYYIRNPVVLPNRINQTVTAGLGDAVIMTEYLPIIPFGILCIVGSAPLAEPNAMPMPFNTERQGILGG